MISPVQSNDRRRQSRGGSPFFYRRLNSRYRAIYHAYIYAFYTFLLDFLNYLFLTHANLEQTFKGFS